MFNSANLGYLILPLNEIVLFEIMPVCEYLTRVYDYISSSTSAVENNVEMKIHHGTFCSDKHFLPPLSRVGLQNWQKKKKKHAV